MPEVSDDGEKYCQGPKCKEPARKLAVKICHHTDCQEGNDMNPLLLCDDCDQSIHVGQAVCHLRFQLPKNFKRTPSIRSANSDSGDEFEAETKQHFDKKNKGYASARRFFNINSSGNQAKKKVSKTKLSEDPGRELLRVRFYEPGCENPHDSEVIPALKGKSLKESISPLFEKRELSFDTHSVFLDASNTPLPLAFDIYPLGGNVLHVRAIDDVKVDKRIIEIAKQSYQKEKEREREENKNAFKKDQYQKGRKNLFSHFGDEKMQSFDYGRNAPQRRSGLYEVPKLRDVTRTFTDILDFYSLYGIDGGRTENEDELDGDNDDFVMEESWTHVIDHAPDLTKKRKDQQEAIWELLTTESNYLQKLNLINKLFLKSLQSLQAEGHLQEIDTERLFGNISEVWEANLSLWSNYLKPIVDQARKEKEILSPALFNDGFARFGEMLQPYMKYCLNEAQCLQYLKNNRHENEKFKMFLTWCENHKLCNRLKLTDLLVKPMQRLTKYPLLIKAILKKTQDQNDKAVVLRMIQNVEAFVSHVNSTLRIRHEQKKTQAVVERLDTYMPVDPVNDEVEKMLMDFSTFDLNCNVPFLSANEHRCVLMEGPMKLAEKQNRTDVYCFLFTDIFLITKGKRSNEKFKVLKQPFRLNKVILKPLKESGGFLFVYLNEYGCLVTAFVLQPSPTETNKWMHNIERAKLRYNKARAGHGSTYEFFDDDLNTPFTYASPHHSPNQERRQSYHQRYFNPSNFELQPSIVINDQLNDQRKPRSYSIEPRRVTSPHGEINKLSESFDSTNKITRSVSDSKKDKTDTTRPLDDIPCWQGGRPVSMIVPSKRYEDISSYMVNDTRSRSESLGLDSPSDNAEARRNESFRSTASDTALTRPELLRNDTRRQMKPSSSAPEVSKVKNGVRRRHSDGASEAPYSHRSMRTHEPSSVSMSSSSTSVSTERGALSRDNSFKHRHRGITELDETSQEENAMGRSTPSFFLELEENADLKESLVYSNRPPVLIDQECQTESIVSFSENGSQTDFFQNIISKVDCEAQTDLENTNSNVGNESRTKEETATQCNLMQRACSYDGCLSAFPRQPDSSSEDRPVGEGMKSFRRSFNGPRRFGLRSCTSETDLRRSQIHGLHYRSFSEDGQMETLTDANGNHQSSVARKRTASSGQLSPGMLALQFLSNSLESSIQPKTVPDKEVSKQVIRKRSSSPLSLRRVALLNSSPVSKRKEKNNVAKGSVKDFLSKLPSKRATWHVDSVTEFEKLEKELLYGSKDDLTIMKCVDDAKCNADAKCNTDAKCNADAKCNTDEKPKRPERKKGKGKKKEEKKKKKKDAESHGIVSGPNMDKRKAQRVFLENSLMHDKPELV